VDTEDLRTGGWHAVARIARLAGMKLMLSPPVLLTLSIAYGALIAVLGALGSSATGTVALIGALVVGGLWAVRGVLQSRH